MATADVAAEAFMAWWALAGVDCAVDEAPVDWLRAPPAPAKAGLARNIHTAMRSGDGGPTSAADAAVAKPAAPATRLPADLVAFRRWLADSPDIIEGQWPGPRVLPSEATGAELMVITDMPDADDIATGALLAGDAGKLFDAMLAAIGIARAQCHVASLAVARPIGGLMGDEDLAPLAERMLHHIALAAPKRVLLLGDRTGRALAATEGGAALRDAPKGLRPVNYPGGMIDAIATLHPRLLLKQPEAKAECWQQLQFLVKGRS
ncbi:uracil-DNA glycosylase family protein [Sphingobium sp. H39-3-25]|uniref:uracil-DNA glycosylase family protein n=1 Tax=Sphingobium arseniciresistens TaxID=3030834 RepID=UPI0023B98BF1|nr:uracil-DNA glycosylase family protein [Sphingobium arseniciresistens]